MYTLIMRTVSLRPGFRGPGLTDGAINHNVDGGWAGAAIAGKGLGLYSSEVKAQLVASKPCAQPVSAVTD